MNIDELNPNIRFSNKLVRKKIKIAAFSKEIANALKNKSIIYDDTKKRMLAITDVGIIEISSDIINALSDTTVTYVEEFKKTVQTKGYDPSNIINTLIILEQLNAGYIESSEITKSNKKFNKILIQGLKNGDEQTKQNIEMAIKAFFMISKDNIPRGRRKYENLKYSFDNERELEFSRCEYISSLLRDGVIDYDFLANSEAIEDFTALSIDRILRRGELLSSSQLEDAFIKSGTFSCREEILEYYFKEDKKFLLNFAKADELMKYVLEGRINSSEVATKIKTDDLAEFDYDLLEKTLSLVEFPKNTAFIDTIGKNDKKEKYLSKEFLRKLDREKFVKLVLSQNIKYKNPFSSIDYINLYGKLNSDDILLLQQNGLVNTEDVIKLITFSSMKVQDENEYDRMISNQLAFYDINRLEELINTGRMNAKFTELFNDLVNNHLTEEQRKEYFEQLLNDLQQKENGAELLSQIACNGINIPTSFGYQINQEELFDMYINDQITENDVLELYKKNLITKEVLKEVYGNEHLKNCYKDGKLPLDIINLLDDRAEFIRDELSSNRINLPEILKLYSDKDGIGIDEFEKIIEGYKFEDENISEYLSDDIPADKINALFDCYYISHDDLSNLVSRGIITKEQADEYAENMSTHKRYEELFNRKNGFVILTNESEEREVSKSKWEEHASSRASKVKNDPELQRSLLETIGFDKRTLQLVGYDNSLDRYKVYPSEEYKVMVFFNEENVGNATYVMSLEQGMYFLNNMERNKGCTKSLSGNRGRLESSVTKGALRETEHVKVKNAARGWGANLIDSISKLSPAFKTKLKENDEYATNINKIVEEIKEDYTMRRE